MDFIPASQAEGHRIALKRTDPRHLPGRVEEGTRESLPPTTPEGSFGQLLARALNGVNGLQHVAMQKSQAMVTDPDSVDVHDVTIALAEANLALSITKAVMDRAIRGYQEIINIR